MKIGINGLWMDSDPSGGAVTYLANLIENLGNIDKENSYTIYYAHSRALKNGYKLSPHFQARVLWPSSHWIEIPISLPLELIRRPIDLLHVPVLAPPVCPCPFVQTIYDLDWELYPEVFPKLKKYRLSKLVPLTAKKAIKIITISEFVKKCVVDFYGIPEEKITVAYPGINSQYRRIEDHKTIKKIRNKYNISGKFILYVGKLQARKNTPRLLKAFHILKREKRLPHKLVLVGRKTFLSSEIFTTIKELDLQDDVIITGIVPLEELPIFYSAAELFTFPTLSEGFGIPPLEAMACGTPVVASNAASLPEVVGEAGIMINPYKVEELAQAMYDVLTNDHLKKELISRGLKQVKAFSYKKMAEQVLNVYNEAFQIIKAGE